MKKIEAIIKPFKLDEVKDAILQLGVGGMTITEVKGFGRQKVTRRSIGARNTWWIFCPRSRSRSSSPRHGPPGAQGIKENAYTGQIGDGKIFVAPVEKAVRIRTGEEDEDAI